MSAIPSVTPEGRATLHSAQLAFYASQAHITVGMAGIRGGKTHAGAFKSLIYAIQNPCSEDECHLVCSPTYPMSKVPVQKIFKLLHDKSLFPYNPLIRYIKSERVFLLQAIDGAITRLQIVSLHDPDKIRGIKALSCWIDEGAYITEDAWDIVQGRVADSNGPIWITTTPAGYNFIHDLYEQARAEKQDGIPIEQRTIRFVHWRSQANTFVSAEGLARLASAYDSRTYAQEVEGLFVKTAGLVYYGFGARNLRRWKLRRDLPVYIGQDFNVASMATIFLQPCTNTSHAGSLQAFHERQEEGDTYGLVTYLDRWCSENNFPKHQIRIYPDASGQARSTAGKSDLKILRESKYKVDYVKKNPFVKDRVNCVNGMLSPRNGVPRYYIDPDECRRVIKCFEKQIWDESDPPVPDKEHGYDHLMDANGYAVWGRYPLRMSAHVGSLRSFERKAA